MCVSQWCLLFWDDPRPTWMHQQSICSIHCFHCRPARGIFILPETRIAKQSESKEGISRSPIPAGRLSVHKPASCSSRSSVRSLISSCASANLPKIGLRRAPGEPCGLPLQMLPTRTMETMGPGPGGGSQPNLLRFWQQQAKLEPEKSHAGMG